MKEAPLARMNFLKHVGRGFTYRSMLYIVAGVFVLLIGIYGVQLIRAYEIGRGVDAANREILRLNAEKEQQIDLIRSIGSKRVNVESKQNITSIIALRPRWSKILRGLVRSLPADVWLDGVTLAGGGDEPYSLRINGKAKSQRVLTTFILQLDSSGLFRKTSLENTKQSEDKTATVDFEMSTQPSMKRLTEDD